MLHRTIITYIVPHVPIIKTYQNHTKKYHSYQKKLYQTRSTTLDSLSGVESLVPFLSFIIAVNFHFAIKSFKHSKNSHFIFKNSEPSGRARRDGRTESFAIRVFGRGNLRKSSWFESYLSIGPFRELIFSITISSRRLSGALTLVTTYFSKKLTFLDMFLRE